MMNEKEIYRDAVAKWGNRSQSDLMIEECSELTQAIIKYRRGIGSVDSVVSEMADVQIMLNQMKVIDKCGHVAKENRTGVLFKCVKCGYSAHADFNAGVNIATIG